MKYMGHKGRMLGAINERIEDLAQDAHALCDAFCGSGVVAWNLAERFSLPVLAGDLQSFATLRAAAILTRTAPLNDLSFIDRWFERAWKLMGEVAAYRIPDTPALERRSSVRDSRTGITRARRYARRTLARVLKSNGHHWPITLAYSGYYFSIEQSLMLDSLRATLPRTPDARAVAMCALIGAASRCCASPGHTAQPLGTSKSSLPHVVDAWNRSIFDYVRDEVEAVAPRYAQVEGEIRIGTWKRIFEFLDSGDVVFCDPPYSDVQYSRFYHVLETLSRGKPVQVSGSGRNPPFSERPESDFSRISKAKHEAEDLLRSAAERNLRLVITFPVSRQSNGLSASTFSRKARRFFGTVESFDVDSVFSSLGGNGSNGNRPAREEKVERIICCSS